MEKQITCVSCGKTPDELSEYVLLARAENYENPTEAVIYGEGTYNPINGHFFCTNCYVKAGMPLGVAP